MPRPTAGAGGEQAEDRTSESVFASTELYCAGGRAVHLRLQELENFAWRAEARGLEKSGKAKVNMRQ